MLSRSIVGFFTTIVAVALGGCMCGQTQVVELTPLDSGIPFPTGHTAPTLSTCSTDCDCQNPDAGPHCAEVGTEIQYKTCVAGTSTCTQPCNPTCPSTQLCVSGVCQPKQCPTQITCPTGLICKQGACVTPQCPTDFQCPSGFTCVNGLCQPQGCTPNCAGMQCGPDGCGGSCGTCAATQACNANNQCVSNCTPNCNGLQCGNDGCGGSCGTCAAGLSCNAGGQCVSNCTPNCTGLQCGNDGCGGSCGTCVSGQTCNAGGQCVSTCSITNPYVTVNGAPWNTTYNLDIASFTEQAQNVSEILTILNEIATGQGACSSLSTPMGVIACIVSIVIIQQGVTVPPFVSQLLTTLQSLFQFGGQTIQATGVMQLVEGTPCPDTLSATETWTHLYMQYNGQQLDFMNSPVLGSAGNVTVTVNPFTGTRDMNNVYLGPRDINFDVNKFIVALIDVGINAATCGQATDVGSLIDLLLCSNIDPIQDPTDYVLCTSAASAIANDFTISSGAGGFHFDSQNAQIIDTQGTGVADELGTQSCPGSVTGQMYNGIISGDLNPSCGPPSTWYGAR
jgi:hypothetical protein